MENRRFHPREVYITIQYQPDSGLMQHLVFPNGTEKIRPVDFGANVCDEGVELMQDYEKRGKATMTGVIFSGTQQGWHTEVNMRLGSRGQWINFENG